MRFAFDAEQLELRDALRTYLAKECTPEAVREAWELPGGLSPERWSALAEMGVVGCTIAEQHGGMGLDATWLVLLLEEAGRAALPEPLGIVAAGATPLLAAVGDTELLAGVASGETVVAIGLPDQPYVEAADTADILLLADGATLHALPTSAATVTRQRTVDPGRRLFAVDWDPAAAKVVAPAAGEAMAAAAAGLLLSDAAGLLGAARKLIDLATTYATQREQFGAPIGSFQAVKHHLATALVETEFARPLVYRAAWSIATGQPARAADVRAAAAAARAAATIAARASLQVHGAIGYTWEHDLHLWLNRAIIPA